jgi:heme/copper-type cytochrome/quinol oxidase subunit 3
MTTTPLRRRSVLDVAHLPNVTLGSEAVIWWGNLLMFAIEGSMFAMVGVTYFYLRDRVAVWPPPGAEGPGLFWPTATTLVLVAAGAPMWAINRACLRRDRGTLRWAVPLTVLLGALALATRTAELRALDFKWSEHAYGSIVWTILGLHTAHLIAFTLELAVMEALLLIGPFRDKHFVDARTTALYWVFVLLAWLPFYGILVLGPR